MTGPTTTGSIDAKLTVDDSDFKRGMAEAKTEAKEVGALEPTVKVDANVGSALAKLEAVAKAERDLDFAYQRSAISQSRLSAVTEKYGEDSAQAASARLAHSRALATESDAEAKLSGLRRKTTEETDKETEATNRSVRANNQRVSGLQVLLALAPAIVATAAPVAGAAVGLGAAFGVMGVSGVLALKGIKDAMEVGDTVGNTYAAGLHRLKGDLNNLAGTSANAMLSSFSITVADINSRMPYLSTMIGSASAGLGQMGTTALRGVLDGLRTMNPLLQAGQVELSKFVTWLFSFNGTSGFHDFITYAVNNLPEVMHLLENLVLTAGHILAAYAPLGPVMLTLLNGLTDGLNSLPLPVLAGLVTTATLLGPALRMAFAPGVSTLITAVAQSIGLTGVMANLAVPVVGILTAAIAGIGVAAAASAISTGTGTASLVDYGNAVERDNGLIGENVRLQAAHAATTKEMRDAADSLGLSTRTVIDAMLGDAAAQSTVTNAMDSAIDRRAQLRRGDENLTETSLRLKHAKDTLTQGIDANSSSITNNVEAYKAYHDAVDAGTGATTAQAFALQQQATQYGTTVAALQAAQSAQDKTGQSTADTTLKMQLQNDAAGLLKMTLDGLNGKAISAAQAQNAFESSLANMGDHVDKVGKKIIFTTTNIGDMSAASVALRGQLNTQVSGLQAVIEANGGLSNSTGAAKAQMETMRQQIIDNAVAHGVDRNAVEAYIDKLLQVPASIPPTKLDVDNAAAAQKIADVQWRLDMLQTHKTIFIDVQQSTSNVDNTGTADGARPKMYANGGRVAYLASGGVPQFKPQGTDTVPAMLTPDEFVMKRASAQSIGHSTLDYMNRTGQLPPSDNAQQSGPVTVNLVLDGKIIDTRIVDLSTTVAQGAIGSAGRDAGRRAAR